MVEFDREEFLRISEEQRRREVKKQALDSMLASLENNKTKTELELDLSEKARVVLQEVAKITQNNLKIVISNLVTTALLSVNKSWPEFEIAIETRRNQSEIDFFFNENGKSQEPLYSSGYGAVDIAASALRVSIWSLNKNRPTFIEDEPFKHLSKDYSVAASKMLKMLCDKLGIQIIIVSHDSEITKFADKVFLVKKTGLVANCTEVNDG